MKNLKVLAINSFATHGMTSLKSAISILKEHVLPVPTVILSGLTNMPGVKKYAVPFEQLLEETLNLVVYRKQRVILYIGYLGATEHVDVLIQAIHRYRDHIETILVDPISGDHGKLYVPPEIAHRWVNLVSLADFIFPNLTELKLLTGNDPNGDQEAEWYARLFIEKFPDKSLVVTSHTMPDNKTGILLYREGRYFRYSQKLLTGNFGGTGDAFISFFILNYFYYSLALEAALKLAADKIYDSVLLSMQQNMDELIFAEMDE